MSRQKTFSFLMVCLGSVGVGLLLGGAYLWYQGIWFTSESSPTVTPAVVTSEAPYILRIEKLGIAANVEAVGLDSAGKMDVPQQPQDVAWYKLGTTPGQVGSAVIAGHFDSTEGPAIFYTLHTLEVGDVVQVEDEHGQQLQFRVTRTASYPYDQFPLAEVFAGGSHRSLNLITCAGSFNAATQNYSQRVVVYTDLID